MLNLANAFIMKLLYLRVGVGVSVGEGRGGGSNILDNAPQTTNLLILSTSLRKPSLMTSI